ncbi:hypothetical protein DUT90_09920 [Polaribacter sp. WD7]|uniref:hypothetical protein n=1 Tax=Polaribacter sp. WD7 TaxID=2269061 RepID=UPI000DF46EE6|nr:hypothetical protein [Polaribacter sp. WD7]RCS26084.1 hypothetical protein DUT90_09920 [Polaribacter sp. WD7]
MKHLTKLLFLFITISAFSQSPWTQEKGKFYTQLSFTSIANYNSLFGDPEILTEREITDNTLQFFGEYGLSDKTSLLVNIPFKLIETGDLTSTNLNPTTTAATESTLGNIELGLKHNFYQKDWTISGQFSVEANTSSFDASSGIRTGYDAWTFSPLLLAGKSFGDTYIQGFLGANLRTNNYSSNFRFGGEIGSRLGKHVWLIAFLDVSSSFKNGDVVIPQENILTGLYVNDQEFGAFGLKAIGEISENFGITAGFGGAFSGNNVAKQGALNIGLYHKF